MSSASSHEPPALSVVIATTQAWPEARDCLESLHRQSLASGAEILLMDGSGAALPEDGQSLFPGVDRIESWGASVFELRALGVGRARAPVVAITEDHCRVAPDWCARILEAHEVHPDAAAIGGAVENGATRHLIDWASFFLVNGASMPPIASGERRTISLQANVSYKKRFLSEDASSRGQMEWMLNRSLRRRGGKLVADERILVKHAQSLGFLKTCRIHYDDGRTIAAFRLEHIGLLERCARLGACLVMPPALLARALFHLASKRRRLGLALGSLPCMSLLVCCKTAGTCVGLLAGPGDSPQRIR